jgi:hypothetical protein
MSSTNLNVFRLNSYMCLARIFKDFFSYPGIMFFFRSCMYKYFPPMVSAS